MQSRAIGILAVLAVLSPATSASAGGGNHGAGGTTQRSSGGNGGGTTPVARTNLGGAERELGRIVVNGVGNAGKLLNGSLGAVGRAGAASGHNGCSRCY